jgi:hypothetical protein
MNTYRYHFPSPEYMEKVCKIFEDIGKNRLGLKIYLEKGNDFYYSNYDNC